ncbi:unnamed protein product [Urochloa humidicola]
MLLEVHPWYLIALGILRVFRTSHAGGLPKQSNLNMVCLSNALHGTHTWSPELPNDYRSVIGFLHSPVLC